MAEVVDEVADEVVDGGAQEDARASPMSERMRELLSRAAEEQLTEQRQVSAVLAELRGLVADLDERLRALEASSGELAQQVADLVLARVVETLVPQLTDSVEQVVRAAHTETEQRLSAHVDQAVLALAEALLRPRRSGRSADPVVPPEPG